MSSIGRTARELRSTRRVDEGGAYSPRVAVVGGGFAGIATAVKLKRAGIASFTVFEQSDGPGGTWWDNRYPGCEVDIPSHAYSFSFMTYDWSGTHAKQEELARYANDVIDRFGLINHFRLGTKVLSARFDDATSQYAVELDTGEVIDFDAVISCLGLLNVPQYPHWPGLSDFDGPVFHTSRWEPQHDLRGKRVALVGTGSTGVQVGPAIAPIVDRLDVYQREPVGFCRRPSGTSRVASARCIAASPSCRSSIAPGCF